VLHDKFNGLIQMKLILTKNNSKKAYRLSSLGLLLLINYYSDYLRKTNEGRDHRRVGNEISQIIKNSRNSVPIIFEIWEDLTKVMNTSNLIHKFDNIASKNIPLSESIQSRGMKEIIVMERIIRETYSRLMNKEYITGLNVHIELEKQQKIPENSTSEALDYMQFLGQMNSSFPKDSDNTSKWLGNKTFDERIEEAISEIISFNFMTNVIEDVKRSTSVNIPNNPDLLNDEIKSHREKWCEFLQKHVPIKTWYQNWISEIIKFEEKNLEILKDPDFIVK